MRCRFRHDQQDPMRCMQHGDIAFRTAVRLRLMGGVCHSVSMSGSIGMWLTSDMLVLGLHMELRGSSLDDGTVQLLNTPHSHYICSWWSLYTQCRQSLVLWTAAEPGRPLASLTILVALGSLTHMTSIYHRKETQGHRQNLGLYPESISSSLSWPVGCGVCWSSSYNANTKQAAGGERDFR